MDCLVDAGGGGTKPVLPFTVPVGGYDPLTPRETPLPLEPNAGGIIR